MKLLFIDVESSGLNPTKNGIIQIAGIIEVDGDIKEEFNFKVKPFAADIIEDKALEVSNTSREDLKTYEEPSVVYKKFNGLLEKYVNRYDKNDKYHLVGQNIKFDNNFIDEWYKKCGNRYWYAYRHYGLIDLITITSLFEIAGYYKGANKKLETVANEFGIEFSAHDALEDIRVTRKIFYKYLEGLKKGE